MNPAVLDDKRKQALAVQTRLAKKGSERMPRAKTKNIVGATNIVSVECQRNGLRALAANGCATSNAVGHSKQGMQHGRH